MSDDSGDRTAPGELGALVRDWRARALLTQEQLATRAGLNVRTIRRLENGSLRRPRSASVRLLIDALRLDAVEAGALTAIARGLPAPAVDKPADRPAPTRAASPDGPPTYAIEIRLARRSRTAEKQTLGQTSASRQAAGIRAPTRWPVCSNLSRTYRSIRSPRAGTHWQDGSAARSAC